MMQRIIWDKLSLWNQQEKPLPLMLIGARQTGKTYLLKAFCNHCFENVIYLNFAENSGYKQFFQPSVAAADILSRMELYFNRELDTAKTVFFFDEIQDCEEAIASLKYFAESEICFHIVSAGSLLGVKLNRLKTSFPVGKVQIEYLYPMDFEEFMWATGKKMLSDEIRNCFVENRPLPDIIHRKALDLYKTYLCTGGMPAVVVNFVKKGENLVALDKSIAANIITGYLADMVKYSGGNSLKINNVYQSMPAQLAKANAKFMYNLVEQGGNKEKFQTAIDWLQQASLVIRCVKVELPQSPLSAYSAENRFKLYLSDTGLLVSLSRINFAEIIQDSAMIYRGFLTENYVAQTFAAKGMELFFWESKSEAEIDFVLNLSGKIIPVEVKASDHVRSKSLLSYMDKYNPPFSIRISARNFGFSGNIKSVPLYAVLCVE
jgi:predicted AAA+ superfamily ATPase